MKTKITLFFDDEIISYIRESTVEEVPIAKVEAGDKKVEPEKEPAQEKK